MSSKQLRNRVNSLIKRDRALKSEDDLKKGKHPFEVARSLLRDTKKQDTIKLIEDQKIVEKEDEVAKLINDYFINKVQDLKKRINQGLKVDPLQKIQKMESRFSFQLVSVDHVHDIIKRMKASNSSGPDGISSKFLKIAGAEVAPALSVLINSSLKQGIFPKQFKLAYVTPIFKNKGSKEELTIDPCPTSPHLEKSWKLLQTFKSPGTLSGLVSWVNTNMAFDQAGLPHQR